MPTAERRSEAVEALGGFGSRAERFENEPVEIDDGDAVARDARFDRGDELGAKRGRSGARLAEPAQSQRHCNLPLAHHPFEIAQERAEKRVAIGRLPVAPERQQIYDIGGRARGRIR